MFTRVVVCATLTQLLLGCGGRTEESEPADPGPTAETSEAPSGGSTWQDVTEPGGVPGPSRLQSCEEVVLVDSNTAFVPGEFCGAEYECQGIELVVECDGENDGTATSLCTCTLDGTAQRTVSERVFEGEGRGACAQAATECSDLIDFE